MDSETRSTPEKDIIIQGKSKPVRNILLPAIPFLLAFQVAVFIVLANLDKLVTLSPDTYPHILHPVSSDFPCDTLLSDVRFLEDSSYSYISVYREFSTECLVLDPFFDVQSHLDLGQQVPWKSVSSVDSDGDGLDELVYAKIFTESSQADPFSSNIDSVQLCAMDATGKLVIFDRLRPERIEGFPRNTNKSFRSLNLFWPTQPDGIHPAQSADYFILSSGDDASEEPFRQLRIYRKGTPPRLAAVVRVPMTVRSGKWQRLPDGRSLFTCTGIPLAFGTTVPVKFLSPDGVSHETILSDANSYTMQIDDHGNMLWARELGVAIGESRLLPQADDVNTIQIAWQTLEPRSSPAPVSCLYTMDWLTGVVRDSLNSDHSLLPVAGWTLSAPPVSLYQSQTEVIIQPEYASGKEPVSLPISVQPPVLLSGTDRDHPLFILNGTDKRIRLVSTDGIEQACQDGGRAFTPLPFAHRIQPTNDIPVVSDSRIQLHRLSPNPSSLWMWKRYQWAILLLIPTPLILLGVYFFIRYRAERSKVKKQKEVYYQTLELRVKLRTHELEDANEKLYAEIDARKIAEDTVLAQHEHLESIFHGVQYGLLTVDRDMKVNKVNQAFSEMHGKPVSSLENLVLTDILTGHDKALSHLVKNAFNGKQAQVTDFELEVDLPAGDNRLLQVHPTVLKDSKGAVSELLLTMRDVTHLHRLQQIVEERYQYRNIIGHSSRMQEVFQLLEDLSNSLSTVLITGDSGTGKELVASALHYGSKRSEGPFVKVNCSALSETLLESELFGHIKGAFTGATRDKAGLFQVARGGTIFLDEIGDISPKMQVSLLRVLQEGEFQRVGDTKTLKTDARIIAATNRNLKKKIQDETFREDLYYRLNVVAIELPPLRERREDIPLLVEHYMLHFNRQMQRSIKGIDDDALELLMQHDWPGNIRELQNILERAYIVCRSDMLRIAHFPAELRAEPLLRGTTGHDIGRRAAGPDPDELDDEAAYILEILEACVWNVSEAARRLDISRQALHKKMKKYNLQRPV